MAHGSFVEAGPWRKVLCPIDDSPQSAFAIQHAVGLCKRIDAHLTIFHAFNYVAVSYAGAPMYGGAYSAEMTEQAKINYDKYVRDMLRKALQYAHDRNFQNVGVAMEETLSIDDAIIEQSPNYDVIVMGTHGHKGATRMFLGSVAESIVRRSNTPVFVVRGTSEENERSDREESVSETRILVPFDGSLYSERALLAVTKFAKAVGARIDLVYVHDKHSVVEACPANVPLTEVESALIGSIESTVLAKGVALAKTVAEMDVQTRVEITDQHPADYIAQMVGNNYDMIVIGTHGRRGIKRAILGSVAEGVLRQSTVPVLTVGHHGS